MNHNRHDPYEGMHPLMYRFCYSQYYWPTMVTVAVIAILLLLAATH